jgi:hypothetical protein
MVAFLRGRFDGREGVGAEGALDALLDLLIALTGGG